MAHCVADVEFARSEGASLIDRDSHSVVVRHGVFVDGEDMLRAVSRPRGDDGRSATLKVCGDIATGRERRHVWLYVKVADESTRSSLAAR